MDCVCAWVAELLTVEDVAERERRRRATQKLVGYFAKHTQRLNFGSDWRRVGPSQRRGRGPSQNLGTETEGERGAVEEAKRRAMASLVCVRHSAQWEAYCQAHDPQRI